MSLAPSKKIFLSILIIGIIVRVLLFIHFLSEPKFFYDDDSYGYIQLAENVRTGHGFSLDNSLPYGPDPFRTPGYPLFLLAHRMLFGSYNFALITQILMVAAISYMIYVIGRDFLKKPLVGYLAAGIFLFTPFSLMVSLRFLTQSLFTFFLILSVLMWLRYLETHINKYFIFAAILFPMCALIRPIAMFFLAPLLFTLIAYKYFGYGAFISWRRIFVLFLIAALFFVAILSPWMMRNYRIYGHFSLSTITYFQLYFYDLPYIYGFSKGISYLDSFIILEHDFNQITGKTSNHIYTQNFSYSKLLQQRFLYYVSQMPGSAVITRIILMFTFFVRDGIRYWFNFYSRNEWPLWQIFSVVIERIFLMFIFVGNIISLAYFIRYKKEMVYIFILFITILYFSFLTGVMASAGLRFPVEPLILLLGINGLYVFKNKLKQIYRYYI